ncbi:MAG: hypothetical protein ACP5D0_09835 [Hydrogenovibrio sp.]
MKTLILTGLVSASVLSAPAAMAEDTWAFDGDEQVIEKMAEQKHTQAASEVLYQEVYQNDMKCWSWDACADKNRVYGPVYETYAFK